MYNGKKILSVIPARGGSKGIPMKNIYPLNGIPLICYTIREAAMSKYIDKYVVSTDNDKICEISKAENADVITRPVELAQDNSKTIDVLIHATSVYSGYDVLILLQPTSPLRTVQNIDESIELFFQNDAMPLCSVSPVSDNPVLIRSIDKKSRLMRLIDSNSNIRRQDLKTYYRVNGAIYIINISEMTKNTSLNDSPIGYIMPRVCSVDIDEMTDLLYAEVILNEKNKLR